MSLDQTQTIEDAYAYKQMLADAGIRPMDNGAFSGRMPPAKTCPLYPADFYKMLVDGDLTRALDHALPEAARIPNNRSQFNVVSADNAGAQVEKFDLNLSAPEEPKLG